MAEDTNKSDKITSEEANATRLLIKEDIKKLQLAKQQGYAQIAILDMRIAEAELSLADIDRREAGVALPEPPKPAAKPTADKPEAEQPAPATGSGDAK